MSNPISRPSALSHGDIDRIVSAMKQHGGNINIQDPRLSQFQMWIWATLGACIVGLGIWLVNSVNTLNQTMERVVTTNQYVVQMVNDHTRRIEQLEQERRK